jgi:hypothetical protein
VQRHKTSTWLSISISNIFYSLEITGSNFTPRSCAQICEPSSLTASIVDITMATPQSSQPDEPYPTLRELRSDSLPVRFSPAAQRLFWPLDGVFPTSISVMKTPHSPDSLDPYFQPDTEGSGSGTWHEISQLPLTEPKVSSVEASVYDLEHWEEVWLEQHREHTAGDAQYVTYGDLSDDDRPYASEIKEDGGWESDSDAEFLVRCCGKDRPVRKAAKLVVKHSAGNQFVTVDDYVSGKSGL